MENNLTSTSNLSLDVPTGNRLEYKCSNIIDCGYKELHINFVYTMANKWFLPGAYINFETSLNDL